MEGDDENQDVQDVQLVFALNPAAATPGIINYGSVTGRKLYEAGIKQMTSELYDCKASGLYQFLREVTLRASQFGWNAKITGITQVPNDLEDLVGSAFTNLVTNHGQITLDKVRDYEKTYIATQTRAAQDTHMLFHCLMNALSEEGKSKILIWEAQYMVTIESGSYQSGNLLLKVIIRESHLDTNATSSSIRTKLSSLDNYIGEIGSDITKFNQYVMVLIDGLRARGETSTDILTNLFKGYAAATDKTFTDYIGRRQETYEEGEMNLKPEELMELASNKFKNLKQKGIWNAPTPEEEKITALEAQVKNLKKATKNPSFGRKADPKQKNTPGTTPSPKKDFKRDELPDWMRKRPTEEELKKPRMYNKKNWYYCHPDTGGKCDGVYRRHMPKECNGKAKRKESSERSTQEPKKLKLTKAMQAIRQNQDDDDDSDE
jgi:hypothetical protein